jgi:PAS domain S-box-containing protein
MRAFDQVFTRTEAGVPSLILGVAQDVTVLEEREQALEELRKASQRLRSQVENSPLAVIEFDPEFRIRRWSEEAEHLFGWKQEEVLGLRPEDFHFIHDEDVPRVQKLVLDMREGRQPRNVSHGRNYRKDGEVLFCEWYNSPLLDVNGHMESLFSLVLNVTDRVQAEAALKEAAQRKDEFFAMLGHELRNPLAPLRHAAEVLERRDSEDPLVVRARQIIMRQVEHLTGLVDDLLDASRVTRGKIRLERQRVDLRDIARECVEDYAEDFRSRRLRLTLGMGESCVWVDADRIRLSQVLGNLLQNAAKFTDPGGSVTVSVGVKGDQAALTVEDDGLGMDEALLARLFEPFAQAERSLERSGGGLGLGLALAKGLVELHAGTIEATSGGLGRGSRFVVQLPLLPAAAELPKVHPLPERRTSSLRVLIIEDNPNAAETLKMLFVMQGHEVLTARSGAEALDMAHHLRPELVLCDIGLPGGMNGYEVARAFRQTPQLRGAFLIAITGYGQEDDQRRAFEAGFDVHLTKPVPFDQIEQLMSRVLPPSHRTASGVRH